MSYFDKQRTKIVKELLSSSTSLEVCILHLGWVMDEFWGDITTNKIVPNALTTYDYLFKNKHTEHNKFHFNNDSCYFLKVQGTNLYNKKVWVYNNSNRIFLFVHDRNDEKFHVRRIFRRWNRNSYLKAKEVSGSLKSSLNNVSTLSEYCDDNNKFVDRPSIEYYKKNNFNIKYEDCRDPGYILSYDGFYAKAGLPARVDTSKISFIDLEVILLYSGCILRAIEEE